MYDSFFRSDRSWTRDINDLSIPQFFLLVYLFFSLQFFHPQESSAPPAADPGQYALTVSPILGTCSGLYVAPVWDAFFSVLKQNRHGWDAKDTVRQRPDCDLLSNSPLFWLLNLFFQKTEKKIPEDAFLKNALTVNPSCLHKDSKEQMRSSTFLLTNIFEQE